MPTEPIQILRGLKNRFLLVQEVYQMGDRALPYILPAIFEPRLQTQKYLNFLAVLRARRQLASRIKAYPIDATIDFVTACQLKCPYCAVGNRTIHRQVNTIGPELFSRIAGELFDAAFIVWFFSAGEPLLHPRIAGLLAKVKQKEIFSVISTNLSLPLNNKKIDDLLYSGLGMLSVSLDGVSPETYSQYRIGGKFHLVLENLQRLVRRKEQLGLDRPLIEWRFLVFEHNQDELSLAIEMAHEVGVDLFEAFPGYAPADSPLGRVRPATVPLGAGLCGPALDRGRQRTETPMQRYLLGRSDPPMPTQLTETLKCDWLYYGTMIYPDGAIGPCCVATDEQDDFTHLDRHGSFLDAWNAPVFERTRRSMREGLPTGTVCDRCALLASRHYQFLQRIRGILRNAPDWVLSVLSFRPEFFFLPMDYELMPLEMEALTSGRMEVEFNVQQVARQLAATKWLADIHADLKAQLVRLFKGWRNQARRL
jgi:pyruvate-formate lyase-activating enzyme